MRATVPEKIQKDFVAIKIYAGDTHNLAVSADNHLYRWGGTEVNTSRISQGMGGETKLKLVEECKNKTVQFIELAYSNTIIIT